MQSTAPAAAAAVDGGDVCLVAPRDARTASVPCSHHGFCPSVVPMTFAVKMADVRVERTLP